MKHTSEDIKQLVQKELDMMRKPVVKKGLESILTVEPIAHLREWDYSRNGEKCECWTVAIDPQTDSSIIFSEYGHGGWGLVSSKELSFGMDSGWFHELEECYLNSFAAGELPIWCVKRETDNKGRIICAEEMNMDCAFKIRDKMAEEDKSGRYHVEIKE
ncbi:MAG: hypothetical protein AAF587_27410 [Bacteroidota bacterium]